MTALTRDLTGLGTPEAVWQQERVPLRLPVRKVASLAPAGGRVLLLAPHPDDEVLGCGGIAAGLARAGLQVDLVAVTDGESSHPGRGDELRSVRAQERVTALARLGLDGAQVHRLGLPDGDVSEDRVVDAVRPLADDAALILAPWEHDGHPDHDAVGRAALRLHGRHLAYLVWAWHWAGPEDLPLDRAIRIPLTDKGMRAKAAAVNAFTSQLEGDAPILPSHVLDRLLRSDEVLIEEQR